MKNILVAIIAICIVNLASGQIKNFIDQPYIEVTGKAEMEITPDEIYIEITLKESDTKGKESVEKLERKLVNTLSSMGIDTEKNLKVKDYSSSFRFYKLKKDDIFKSKEYELTLHNPKKIGPLFYRLEQQGISNMDILKIGHSKMEEFRLEVKTLAAKAAQLKAKHLAASVNQEIGKAIHIQEVDYPSFGNSNMMIRGIASEKFDEAPTTNLEFESIKLSAKVRAKFELK